MIVTVTPNPSIDKPSSRRAFVWALFTAQKRSSLAGREGERRPDDQTAGRRVRVYFWQDTAGAGSPINWSRRRFRRAPHGWTTRRTCTSILDPETAS
jgi:hypothetical protein